MPISFTNSRFPCLDFDESCFTAITVPSDNRPCIQESKWFYIQDSLGKASIFSSWRMKLVDVEIIGQGVRPRLVTHRLEMKYSSTLSKRNLDLPSTRHFLGETQEKQKWCTGHVDIWDCVLRHARGGQSGQYCIGWGRVVTQGPP